MPNLDYAYFYNSTYIDRFTQWGKLRDCFAGNERVKEAGTVYLPKPASLNDTKYSAYKTRALFYPVIERTVRGLLGVMFRIKPTFKLPERMKPMVDAATPEGDSLFEVARTTAYEVLLMGRHGLLVDLPEAAEPEQTPFIAQFSAENITNWSRQYLNGARTLTSVMLRDNIEGAGAQDQERLLELYLEYTADENGHLTSEPVYKARRWLVQVDHRGKQAKALGQPTELTPQIQGRTLPYIPFYFVGPFSNKPPIEKSPLLDVADANLAHYRMDADYRHALYLVAQPTPYIIGDVEDSQLPTAIGAGQFWNLPSTVQDIGMLEFSGAGIDAIAAALERTEGYMAALGAKLIHRQVQPETAEAVRVRSRDELSVIENVAQSVHDALGMALKDAAEWYGQKPDEVAVQINSDFAEGKLDPAMLAQLVASWQAGAISRDVYHRNLQRGEIMPPDRTVQQEEKAIAEEKAKAAPAPSAPPAEDEAGETESEEVDPALLGTDDAPAPDPNRDRVVTSGNPYKVLARSGAFCVVKADSGELVKGGCHPSKARALAHFKALEAATATE